MIGETIVSLHSICEKEFLMLKVLGQLHGPPMVSSQESFLTSAQSGESKKVFTPGVATVANVNQYLGGRT